MALLLKRVITSAVAISGLPFGRTCIYSQARSTMPAPTELPHLVQSFESTTYSTDLTTQSLDTATTTTGSDLLSPTHGVTVDDLSTAVYICIAVAILLFVMAIILSVVIAVLSYKQRRLRALQRTKTLRRDSDEIWSASV